MKSPGSVVSRILLFPEGKFSSLISSALVNEIYVFLKPPGSWLRSLVEWCYRLEDLIDDPSRDSQRMT